MPLIINGTQINKVVANGTEIQKVVSNGTEVWVSYVTVRWINWDGTVLKTELVGYNQQATPPSTPTKPSDVQYTYTFREWDKPYDNITVNTDITAVFTQSLRYYTVSFDSNNSYYGDVSPKIYMSLYNEVITSNENKIVSNGAVICTATARATDAEYFFSFNNWTNGSVTITSDITITAKFEAERRYYDITWYGDGGDPSKTVISQPYGAMPQAPYVIREGYTLNGWIPTVKTVTRTASYNAKWVETPVRQILGAKPLFDLSFASTTEKSFTLNFLPDFGGTVILYGYTQIYYTGSSSACYCHGDLTTGGSITTTWSAKVTFVGTQIVGSSGSPEGTGGLQMKTNGDSPVITFTLLYSGHPPTYNANVKIDKIDYR